MSAPSQAPAEVDPRRWTSLAVVLVAAFMILLDVTIVNVAIPSMQVDLGASYGAIEWVVSGYALSYGLTLIPGGRLGDRFGYRRLFLLGMIGFVATSALCGFASAIGFSFASASSYFCCRSRLVTAASLLGAKPGSMVSIDW